MTEETIETRVDFYQAAWDDDVAIEALRKELSAALADFCAARSAYESAILTNQ
jgi:hypothetical protein